MFVLFHYIYFSAAKIVSEFNEIGVSNLNSVVLFGVSMTDRHKFMLLTRNIEYYRI